MPLLVQDERRSRRGLGYLPLALAVLLAIPLNSWAADESAEWQFERSEPTTTSRHTVTIPQAPGGIHDPQDVRSAEEPRFELPKLEEYASQPFLLPALQQEVTTVTGQRSTVGRSPNAVFVVTQEMIRRSGATSIPEVLRTVPGLQVARVNSNQWAITARGFNTNVAGLFASNNKLLVLIDGRTVYTPFFNGTYWDVQDVLLDDIERIEVIRGPGATIWGSNAVNGVVNIITKPAADTQKTLVKGGGGTEERGFAATRLGGRIGKNVHYRVYGKGFERDTSFSTNGRAVDDWRQARAGFRCDWTPNCDDTLTIQGDVYEGRTGIFNSRIGAGDDETVIGGNLLTRWTRTFGNDSDMSLQYYYDRADRSNNIGYLDQQIGTHDVDFRHHFGFGCRHNIVWGLGYRSVQDQIRPLGTPPVVYLDPAERRYEKYSTFVQDEILLVEDAWFVTLGAKLENNDFTGFEIQPSARLLWAPEQSWAAWAAVSRAVRTPSRVEDDLRVSIGGAPPIIALSQSFDAENVMAYELGYRAQPEECYSYDVSLFYNQYENLASFRFDPPYVNTNDNRGAGYGVELSAKMEMNEYWQVSGWYSFLQLQIQPGALSVPSARGEEVEGSSPHNQAYVMSSHELWEDVELDAIGRYVDNLPFQSVSSYVALDLRLGWRPTSRTEFAVVGQNLLDAHHAEFGDGWEIERGVYGMIRCEY